MRRRKNLAQDVFSVSRRELNRAFGEGFEDGREYPDLDADRLLLTYLEDRVSAGMDHADAYILAHAYYLGFLTGASLVEERPNPILAAWRGR